jgi:hypothetical protein
MDEDKACIANFVCAMWFLATYAGDVILQGESAPDGTLVEAYVGGIRWNVAFTFEGRYAFDVPAHSDDPPCFEPGHVVFYAGGEACEPSPEWASGLHEVNLTCG